jgi:hypothetical protein
MKKRESQSTAPFKNSNRLQTETRRYFDCLSDQARAEEDRLAEQFCLLVKEIDLDVDDPEPDAALDQP